MATRRRLIATLHGGRVVAATIGLLAVPACTVAPPGAPAIEPEPLGTIVAAAGFDGHDPFTERTPTDPAPADDLRLNVYARTVVTVDADTVLVSNYNEIVRYEEADATVRRIAGAGIDLDVGGTQDGVPLPAAFDGPAVAAFIDEPVALAPAPDGSVLFAPVAGGWIARVDPAGILRHVAGDGTVGATGDGGPAVSAGVGTVTRILVADDGDVWFIDDDGVRGRHLRVIDADSGTVATHWDPPGSGASPEDPSPWLDLGTDGQVRDLGPDPDGALAVRRLTPLGPVAVPLSGPCAGAPAGTVLDGALADRRRQVLIETTPARVCTVDPVTGTTTSTRLDLSASTRLIGGFADLFPISGLATGPDGRRWFIAWESFPDGGRTLRMWRWVGGP